MLAVGLSVLVMGGLDSLSKSFSTVAELVIKNGSLVFQLLGHIGRRE